MAYFKEVKIIDDSGNKIDAHQDIEGGWYSGVSAIQSVNADPNNSSTTNLASGNSYTFTGTGTSTLGVAGLQWNLKTDQNATIYIEQSDDNTNWDISDSFAYYYSKGGMGGTVQAITNYFRIRVVLTGTTDTTYFRLNGVLCPIVEALPRSLDTYERLKCSSNLIDAETGTRAEVEPLGSLKTVSPVRLVGTSFGAVEDANFWTKTVTGSGAVTFDGQATVSTGATADSTAKLVSVRKGRYVPGATNQFRAVARLSTVAEADNIRRFGAYDTNDGFFFQVDGTTFGVGSRKGASDTIVSSGSFNGNYGASVTMDTTIKRLVITYTNVSAKFYVNDILLHTISASTTTSTNTLTLAITMENINSNGNTTDNSFQVRFACIMRLGELLTESIYKYLTTGAGTVVCKYGAGVIHNMIIQDGAAGSSIGIYDALSAVNPILIFNTASIASPQSITFNCPFSTGLTVVITGTVSTVIIYE